MDLVKENVPGSIAWRWVFFDINSEGDEERNNDTVNAPACVCVNSIDVHVLDLEFRSQTESSLFNEKDVQDLKIKIVYSLKLLKMVAVYLSHVL